MYKLVFHDKKNRWYSKTITLWESVVEYREYLDKKGYPYITYVKQEEQWILIQGEGESGSTNNK